MQRTQNGRAEKRAQEFERHRLQVEAMLDQEKRQREARLAKAPSPSNGEGKSAPVVGPRPTHAEWKFDGPANQIPTKVPCGRDGARLAAPLALNPSFLGADGAPAA